MVKFFFATEPNFDFCYGSGVKTKPGAKIKRIVAIASLIINSADILRARGHNHSDRSTIIGSTFVARRAGIQQARSATTMSNNAITATVSGSVTLTP